MAEKPEDLNLPNAVISRLVKETVSYVHRQYIFTSKLYIILKFSFLPEIYHYNMLAQGALISEFYENNTITLIHY